MSRVETGGTQRAALDPDEGAPDPTQVRTLAELSQQLDLLRVRAARGTRSVRVSLDDLARRVGEPRSSVHAYVVGARLAPSQVLDRIVIALGASSREQREWAEAWYRVCNNRHAAPHETGPHGAVERAVREAIPHQLPPPVDTFVGRAEQLAELDELANHARTGVVVAVSGTAGSGKTALAVHWAQTRRHLFPDGQLHLDLCGFDPHEPMATGQALSRLLRALGTSDRDIAADLDERSAQLRSALSGRRLLLVLDNARDTEQVRALLPGPPTCTVVTSRNSLTGLVVRHGAHRLDLDVLSLAEATHLLQLLIGTRGGAARGPAPTEPTQPTELTGLAEACARLPLAVRIAADVVGSRPGLRLADLTQSVAAESGGLELFEAGDDARTGLRAVFSWSYRILPPPAARAFRLIGLHPSTDLTADAMAALLGAAEVEAGKALGLLTQANLVRPVRWGRYRTHGLLRAYARELSIATDPEPEREAAIARLHAYERGRSAQGARPVDLTGAAHLASYHGAVAGAASAT